MSETWLRGASVIDGTGTPAIPADVLIEDGRVQDVVGRSGESPPRKAGQDVDCSGLTVCPGFIDLHSHGDLIHTLPAARQHVLMKGRLAQGITTEVVGNCGLGVFPVASTEEGMALQRAVIQWMTPEDAVDWPAGGWSDLAGYLERLERAGTWANVGALQPHGPLRMAACGLDAGEPSPSQRRLMKRDLDRALDAGAFGLSTGLIYPPGIFTPTDELVALARRVARRRLREGFVASHIRGSSETLIPAVEELLAIAKVTGVRVHHSHNEAVGPEHWGKIESVLAREEAAARSGMSIAFDMFPYTGAATMMLAIFPPWSLEGGVGALLGRLSDPRMRASIGESIARTEPVWPPWGKNGWPHNLVRACGWDRITIGSVGSVTNRGVEGLSLADLGRLRKRTPFDAIADLMIEERGAVSQIIHGVSGEDGHEEGLEAILAHPLGAVCTDANDFGRGRPHPAAWGAFPRVLGRFVRERRLLDLPGAIRKMTSYPAALLRLKDRGVIRPGAWADLVVFDPATVGSSASWDAPRQPADGIRLVFVNGVSVAGDLELQLDAKPPGMVLRN